MPAGAYQFQSDAVLRSVTANVLDVITLRLFIAFDLSV
jgi:hypothetical protein